MTKKEIVQSFKRIGIELHGLHSSAANYISRKDNNRVFELALYLNEVAGRIQAGYKNLEYYAPNRIRPTYVEPGSDQEATAIVKRVVELEKALKAISSNSFGLQGLIEDGASDKEISAYWASEVSRLKKIARSVEKDS